MSAVDIPVRTPVAAGTTGIRKYLSTNLALQGAAAVWLLIALAGQWAFLYYIAAFYGSSTLAGDLEVWNRLEALGASPYKAGDTAGNLAFAAHALGAGIIAFGGALQLMPQVRRYAPRFHRWNGRVFLFTVVALSLSGFYLVWVRNGGQVANPYSVSLNGLLILAFAYLAFHFARVRNLVAHRRWAMRLYLVANAQWFIRVGVFAYFAVSRLLGLEAGFSDPFLRFWPFGCYLVPLAILELYLWARDSRTSLARGGVAAALFVITVVMAIGIIAFGVFSQMIISGAPLSLPG